MGGVRILSAALGVYFFMFKEGKRWHSAGTQSWWLWDESSKFKWVDKKGLRSLNWSNNSN